MKGNLASIDQAMLTGVVFQPGVSPASFPSYLSRTKDPPDVVPYTSRLTVGLKNICWDLICKGIPVQKAYSPCCRYNHQFLIEGSHLILPSRAPVSLNLRAPFCKAESCRMLPLSVCLFPLTD